MQGIGDCFMTKTEKVFELALLLFNARFGYTTSELCSKLDCSEKNIRRNPRWCVD